MSKKLYTVYLSKNGQRIMEELIETGEFEHASAVVEEALPCLESRLENLKFDAEARRARKEI